MRDSFTRRLLSLLMLGIVSVAFAMGTVNARIPDSAELQLEALMLSGMSLHDLCITDEAAAHKHDPDCALCLSFAPPVISLPDFAVADAGHTARVILPQIRRAAFHRVDPSTPLRGPPQAPFTPA